MVPTLRPSRGMSARQESANNHFLPDHHCCILVGLGCLWLGYVGGGVKLFNKYVDFAALRYMLSQFISHWCKILYRNIPRAEIPGYTYCKGWTEEISVLNVDVREQRAIY